MAQITNAERIQRVIAEQLGYELPVVTLDKGLVADLGADSLDEIELVMAIEDEFGIPEISDRDAESVVTVGDAVALVDRLLAA